MKLSKTNSGSWAKQVGIGSDFESFEIVADLAAAEARLSHYIANVPRGQEGLAKKLCIRETTAGGKLVDRLGVPVGATCYMIGRLKKQRQAMTHASAAECEAAGRVPGRSNL